MNELRRGYLYRIRMPGEGKERPVLVLSQDRRNDLAYDVTVVPCSTVLRLGPWHVPLRRGEGGLPQSSVAKCEQITTLPKARIRGAALGGRLSAERLAEIRAAVLHALDFDE
jgi:mRNA-degrading endonuclease toxin of MazEF toxin-antitoxin module